MKEGTRYIIALCADSLIILMVSYAVYLIDVSNTHLYLKVLWTFFGLLTIAKTIHSLIRIGTHINTEDNNKKEGEKDV